ncbi:MAG: hypothetical protein ACRDRK_24740 [Pseudonocardia sp.]
MNASDSDLRAVAVVRVLGHGHAAAEDLLVEVLEVGRDGGVDRVLGRATTVAGACLVLEEWLTALAKPGGAHTGPEQ